MGTGGPFRTVAVHSELYRPGKGLPGCEGYGFKRVAVHSELYRKQKDKWPGIINDASDDIASLAVYEDPTLKTMQILVLNCGSSSIKYSLFNRKLDRIIKGAVERISSQDACILLCRSDMSESKKICNIPDHKTALEYILENIEKTASLLSATGSCMAVRNCLIQSG